MMCAMPFYSFSCKTFLSYASCDTYHKAMMIGSCAVIVGAQCTRLAQPRLLLRRLHESVPILFLTSICGCVCNALTQVILVYQNHIT